MYDNEDDSLTRPVIEAIAFVATDSYRIAGFANRTKPIPISAMPLAKTTVEGFMVDVGRPGRSAAEVKSG